MGKAIEIKGLVKRYGKFTAVDGIDLDVESGSLFALLGENGAGKTTTIKATCGLTRFDAGEIKVCGYDVKSEYGEIRKIINVAPQETAVAARLTVKENLLLSADLYGIADRARTAAKFIDEFGLREAENKRAGTLSGGMQRRLSLAMALGPEPQVLFLDEPTLGLDVRARRDLWRELKNLKGRMTVVLTTHYLEESEALSDGVAIMKNGKILVCGTAEEIKKRAGEDSFEEAFLKITGDDYAQD